MELQEQVTALQIELQTLKAEFSAIKTQLSTKTIDWEEREFQVKLAVIQGKIAEGSVLKPSDIVAISNMITKDIITDLRTNNVG